MYAGWAQSCPGSRFQECDISTSCTVGLPRPHIRRNHVDAKLYYLTRDMPLGCETCIRLGSSVQNRARTDDCCHKISALSSQVYEEMFHSKAPAFQISNQTLWSLSPSHKLSLWTSQVSQTLGIGADAHLPPLEGHANLRCL